MLDKGKQSLVARQTFYNPDGKNLYVIFLPWHSGGDIPWKWLSRRIIRRNNAVIEYRWTDSTLSADAEYTLKAYKFIAGQIVKEFSEITRQHEYGRVNLIGMSLGNVILSLVASQLNNFDRVTMICTASSLAKSLWYGNKTREIYYEMIERKVTLFDLKKVWRDIEPINHIGVFRNKNVRVVVSKTDTSIPARFQVEYVEQAKKQIKHLKVKTTRLGHYGAIIKYCLIGKL